MAADDNGSKSLAIKELTFIALFSLMFSSMMGSGVFDIPQNVAHASGLVAVIISWSITAVGMLALAWAFVYLTKHRPDIKSGIYGYAKYGFGDYVGFNAAWGYWLNALLGNASYIIYIFATLANFAIFKSFSKGNTVSALLVESALIWLVYCLINRGIREAAIVNVLIAIIKVLALITVVTVFIYGFKLELFKSNFMYDLRATNIVKEIKSTMLITVWDFLGIEAACIYALRAKSMADVAKATMFGVIVVLLIDVLISILPFGIVSSLELRDLATPSTATLLDMVSGNFSAIVIRLAVIISVAGALLAWTMLATNILYLAAVDNTFPKFIKKLNSRKVPRNSLFVSTLTLQAFIVVAFYTNSVYLVMIQLATSLILIPYLLSALFAFKLIFQNGVIDYLSLFKGFIAIFYGCWIVYAGGLNYLVFSSIFYVIGIGIYFIARREQKLVLFQSKFEKILCAIITVTCVMAIANKII